MCEREGAGTAQGEVANSIAWKPGLLLYLLEKHRARAAVNLMLCISGELIT